MSWKTLVAHAVVCAALLVVPSLWFAPTTLWRLDPLHLAVLALFPLAYVVTVLVARVQRNGAWLVGLASFGILFFVLALWQRAAPDGVVGTVPWQALATGFALGVVALPLVLASRAMPAVAIALVSVPLLVGATGQLAFRQKWLPRPPAPNVVVSRLDSAFYPLQLARHEHVLRMTARRGGGVARWGTGFLVGNGDGELFRVDESAPGRPVHVRRLPWRVPLDVDGFRAGAREVFARSPVQSVELTRFRVAHVLVDERGARTRLLATHHAWDAKRRCFTLRLSALEGAAARFRIDDSTLTWRTVYDTTPCLPLNTAGPRGARFEGLENGGRMVLAGRDEVLLTVGDHGFDGENRREVLAQDASNAYGKVLRVDLASGRATVVSVGHRNPQGLYVARDGAIWSTEHGPRGGDELNLIRAGANYGWPRVVYGTDYGRHTWPANDAQGRHEGFEPPVYAFVPSPALSNLVEVDGEAFPLWRGDLVVGTLAGQSLHRLHLEAGRVVVVEPIPVGDRVRDLTVARDGRLVLWMDSGTLAFLAPAAEGAGEALVAQCTSCHGLAVWDRSYAGPTLAGIVGRPVASVRDYAYSDALGKLGGRWTRDRLDAFLANPESVAPGTAMQFAGIADREQRARLIDFLEHSGSLQ